MPKGIRKIDDYRWEVSIGYKEGMLVPGIIYADERMLDNIIKENSIEQVVNGATLPGIVKASLAMPDIHFGYGLPIGGVVATRLNDGVVSPGGTGYDINCGVRLIRSNLKLEGIREKIRYLIDTLYANVPTGVGSRGKVNLSHNEEKEVLIKGARWAIEKGYGDPDDLKYTEANGCLEGADPDKVSNKAYERGRRQQGTLGAGNHFVEIQYVEEVFEKEIADTFGLEEDGITVMIHSGSRGFGHQVCTDYLEVMDRAVERYGIKLPDRQLACAPINSPEGKDYLSAMKAAANYAWANRQCLMSWTRDVFQKVLSIGPRELGMSLVYDIAHNIVKIEEHTIDGKKIMVAVHRKGATRAFPANHPEIPDAYKGVGQPVIIPGDMGRNSYVLVGTERAMDETFGSTCHGAGRIMSRHAAIRAAKGRAINRELEDQGIYAKAGSRDSLKEEMSDAYKDISDVVNIVHNAGISLKVAKLKPLGVIKG
ncbi:MAG: RtcB family protein [Nitrospinae bacterium]|nr:RtcB family protein [Nitrospinota bacterium]